VMAANLADRGFTGPHDILEGEFGFLRVFCNEWDMSDLTKGLARPSHSASKLRCTRTIRVVPPHAGSR